MDYDPVLGGRSSNWQELGLERFELRSGMELNICASLVWVNKIHITLWVGGK